MATNDDKLDEYLRDANRPVPKKKAGPSKPSLPREMKLTDFRRWAASSAMDLFKIYVPLILLLISGGLCLVIEPSIAGYFFYGAIAFLIPATLFLLYDFYHYKTWQARLPYKMEGWNSALNSRSRKYFDMNGEHWISTRVTIVVNEPVNAKHLQVLETFLKKLSKRLNQWTVSAEQRLGYTQPTGWSCDGLTLVGDMNPRVSNLLRKKLSGELNNLGRLMPGTIQKVLISVSGPEKYHEVYHESTD